MTLAPLADDGDLLLELLLRGGQHGAPRRGVGPLGLERGQLPFHGGQSRRLDERGTPVLELRDGGVEVLDGEQARQVVGHAVASYAARARGSASISAGSAIPSASSQLAPAGVGALVRRWHRVGVRAEQQVAQVEVRVAVGGLVDVEVEQQRTRRGMLDRETELLGGLAQRRVFGTLAGVDVAAGLHPDAEPLVPVQHRAAAADHDARRGHVDRAGVLVAGRTEAVELGEEALLGHHFPR